MKFKLQKQGVTKILKPNPTTTKACDCTHTAYHHNTKDLCAPFHFLSSFMAYQKVRMLIKEKEQASGLKIMAMKLALLVLTGIKTALI